MIEQVLSDDARWRDADAMRESRKAVTTLVEAQSADTGDGREFMDKLIQVASNHLRGYVALAAFATSDRVRTDTGLRNEFEAKLLDVVKDHRTEFYSLAAFDTVGLVNDFYRIEPGHSEQKVYLDLLEDTRTHPIIRATAAMFLGNTTNAATAERVKRTSEKLLRVYERLFGETLQEREEIGEVLWPTPLYGDSRTSGRLAIALERIARQSSNRLRSP
jgi:hypothetical protein